LSIKIQKKELVDIFLEDKGEIELIKQRINQLCKKHSIEDAEVLYLTRKSKDYHFVPIEIFSQMLSPLEAIVNYLRNNMGYRFCEIAGLLLRDDRTVWITYQKSLLKQKRLYVPRKSIAPIPLKIFRNRKLSILELISVYLVQKKSYRLSQIATLLNKNTSTVWTVLSRAHKKQSAEVSK